MPIRRGRYAPQNTFLETIAEKFDRGNSNFVLGSAQEQNNYPIVYCSDGFCELSGFSRSELMRRSCACNFLYGLESNQEDIRGIKTALTTRTELKREILFYKKNGSPFWCLLDIVPIKNENGNVVLFLASHKDISKRRFSGEVREDDTASLVSQASGQATQKLSRSKSRKFSRDVLLHLSRQYGQSSTANSKPSTRRAVKRTRSFSFTSERLPQYKLESTKKSKFLLVHYSTAKGLWDWGIILLTIYIAIMVPFNVAFQGENRVRALVAVDMVIQMFFITDIVVHFRTTYVDPSGKIIYDQKKIAAHYLKSWFILDFLAALPFEALYFINQSWVSSTFSGKPSFNKGFLIQLLKCGRLVRLLRVIRKLHRYTDYSTVLLSLLMMAFALVAHWLACIWFVIGQAEIDNHSKVSWLYQLGETIDMSYGNFSEKGRGPNGGSAYITALYFTLTSMTTVGFGNVSANTNGEKVFAVIVMLIGALMHAAIFGNVAAIIQKLYANRVRYHSRANEIKQFIRVQRIEQDLSNRLEDYFHNTWSLSGGVDTREILTTFPPELQAEVCMHMYRGMLELPAFSQASRGCLRMLSLQVRPVYVSPGELLITQSDVVNALYYIASGSMEVLQGESVAAILGKGDLFGEDITRKMPVRRSNGDVRALTYCDIYYVTRDRFHDVLHLYSDFAYKFTDKLELTYDLGASEKDIWRRGGLDSISEDEEEDEDDEKDEKAEEAVAPKQNGSCRSGRKARPGPSSPFYRRRANFTAPGWRPRLGRASDENKSGANQVESEPLLRGLSEERRHALSRQCAVDVNVSGSSATPQSSPNKKLARSPSSQSLEWEKENLSLHEEGREADSNSGSGNTRSGDEEDRTSPSQSTTSDLFDSKSPAVCPQDNIEGFSNHLYISCEYPPDIIHPTNPHDFARVGSKAPELVTDGSSDSDGENVLGNTEFQNPHRRDGLSNRNSPLFDAPFSSTALDYPQSDSGSARRRFAELPFHCGTSSVIIGGSVSPAPCSSPDGSFLQNSQDAEHSSMADLPASGGPAKRLLSAESGNEFLSATFPGLSNTRGRIENNDQSYENGCGFRGTSRQISAPVQSPAGSNRSLNERSPVPARRRKQSSVIQPPILFAPLMLTVNNPYKDFVPPSRESLVSSCMESASSQEEIGGGETGLENARGDGFYTSGTSKHDSSEDEAEAALPFVPSGDRHRKLYGRGLSTRTSSPLTTDCSITSPGAASETLSTEFLHHDPSRYEEDYYFPRGFADLSPLTGARSTRSMKCDGMNTDRLSPPRPIRSSFSEPRLHSDAVLSSWETRRHTKDENSNIPHKKTRTHEPEGVGDAQELNTEELEEIFRDVTTARDAMEKLQTILSSPEPDICAELGETKQTVQRLDRQVFDLNKEVSSLSSDIKMVLQLLKGLRDDQALG